MSNLDALDSLDSLLDKNLDDIADLPEWRIFPAGVHKITVNWDTKEREWMDKDKNEKQKGKVVVCKVTHISTEEQVDKNETPLTEGAQATVEFNPYYEQQISALKGVLKNMEATVGSNNLKELIKGTEGFEVLMVSKVRKWKKDGKEGEQMQISEFYPSV